MRPQFSLSAATTELLTICNSVVVLFVVAVVSAQSPSDEVVAGNGLEPDGGVEHLGELLLLLLLCCCCSRLLMPSLSLYVVLLVTLLLVL